MGECLFEWAPDGTLEASRCVWNGLQNLRTWESSWTSRLECTLDPRDPKGLYRAGGSHSGVYRDLITVRTPDGPQILLNTGLDSVEDQVPEILKQRNRFGITSAG